MNNGNWFATLALVSWPFVAVYLYRTQPVSKATVWTILGAHLLLPAWLSIKFAMIPPFDKVSIPNLAALGCLLVMGYPIRLWNRFGIVEILMLMFLISPFITSELNSDEFSVGRTLLPGVGPYDAVSAVIGESIFWLPFILGRQLLRSSADNAEILRALVIAGLLYSVPMLFEIRMSPQLHAWVYGYFPHEFAQQIRDGGFRPVVFLGHGLIVAFFAMTTAVAAAALWKTQTRVGRLNPGGVTAYLSMMLFLCKSLGSLIYGAVLIPLVRFAQPRLQLRVATVLVAIALSYPMLRASDLVPAELIVESIRSISEERANSLKLRFDQEQLLLEHTSQRWLFGWGRFGRSRIYDPISGEDITTSDGYWIITMGIYGWFGYLAQFGMLALPVFRAASALRYTKGMHDRVNLAALALIVAISMVDLLPNGFLNPWTWLLAGALLGRAEALTSVRRHNAAFVAEARPQSRELVARGLQRSK
jgi:hypothetical protein